MKKRKVLYRRADSTFPDLCAIAHYIVASERGIEALRATIIFSMWSIIPILFTQHVPKYSTRMMRLPLFLLAPVACWE